MRFMCVWSPIERRVWSRVCASVYTPGLALDRAQYFDPRRIAGVAMRYNKLAIKRERFGIGEAAIRDSDCDCDSDETQTHSLELHASRFLSYRII